MKSLTGVIFKNSKRRDSKNKSTATEAVLGVVSFVIVFFFLGGIMFLASDYVTRKLTEIDQTYAFVNILLLMNFMLLFAKSVFESLNVLYFSKDLRVLLRLPIKSKDILNAKLLNMIVSEYEMEIIMLAIPMVVYGIQTGVGGLFYLYMIAILLVLPVIPIIITSLIIAIIMRFTNHIKNKSKVMYITMIVAVFIVGIVTMIFQSDIDFSTSGFENIILTANGLSEAIADMFVLIKPIMNTLLNYDNIAGLQNLIIYILESVVFYKIAVWIMSKIYLEGAIGTTINSTHGKVAKNRELTIDDFQKRNKNKAYLSKEFKVLSRTPIFLIQCLIMPIVYPIAVFAIMAVFVFLAMRIDINVLDEFYNTLTKTYGQAIFIGIAQVFYMMNFCSIIAVSKESKNSIISKYIPMKLNKQFSLKIRIGVLINMISAVIVAICYWVCMKNILNSIIIFVIFIFLNLICEKIKLFIDLKNPQISWDNEYTMMKQNTNVLYELFYTLIIIGIMLLISRIIENVLLYLIVLLAISILVNMIINEYIYKKQKHIFRKVF